MASDENLFAPVEFPYNVNLKPSAMHKGMYKILETQVSKELSDTCRPNIGYIKPGSVQILNKTLGQICGSHATGNVTFKLQVRCLVTQPVIGQRLQCMVIGKNDSGVLAKNYTLPYMLFVPKIPNDPHSDDLDRVQISSDIEVSVQRWKLNAPSKASPKAEYWVICDLLKTDVEELKHHSLPTTDVRPVIVPSEFLTADNINRTDLTDKAYTDLETVKTSISEAIKEYVDVLETQIASDPVIRSEVAYKKGNNKEFVLQRERFTVGRVVESLGVGKCKVFVLYTNTKADVHSEVVLEYSTVFDTEPNAGTILVHYALENKKNVAKILDFWSFHIKYIVNPFEMIQLSKDHIGQIEYAGHILGTPVPKVQSVENPPSRAYFKMREMYQEFGLLNEVESAKILCVAEAPGGFINAITNIRGSAHKDTIIGISIPTRPEQGVWDLLEMRLRDQKHITIRTEPGQPRGAGTNLDLIGGIKRDDKNQGKGDILVNHMYNVDKLLSGDEVPNDPMLEDDEKADLVTADGGFPHDKSASIEEMECSELILAEAITALRAQRSGGTFILKIFDMATEFTAGLVQVLSYCYDTVSVYKPMTSRNASSEKYLICKGFRNREEMPEIISDLQKVLLAIQSNTDKETFMKSLLAGGVEDNLKSAIKTYNTKFMRKQMTFITDGVAYSKVYCEKLRNGQFNEILKTITAKANTQYNNALRFYDKHGIKYKTS